MKTLLFILSVFLSPMAFAQHVTGTITDENNQPLSEASVYFDGSTIGTLSQEDGSFKIDYKEQSNLTLIVRYLGYKTYYLSNPDPEKEYAITLSPEENQLDEVVLDKSIFSRKEMLKAFERDFLGKTRAGRRAEILNKEAIKFYYDKDEKSLYATANQPIQVNNKILGYKVEFDLMDFVSKFSKVSLDDNDQKSNYFGGTSFFQDSSENKRKFKRRRSRAYKGSSMHFFKSLCAGKLKEERFQVYHKSYQVPVSSVFEIEKSTKATHTTSDLETGSYKITILGNDLKVLKTGSKTRFLKKIAVVYKGKQTDISFKTNVFYVDDFGNHTHISHIIFSGEMSKSRLGEMLPKNYQPND